MWKISNEKMDKLKLHLSNLKNKIINNKGNIASIVGDGIIGAIGIINPPTGLLFEISKKAEELRRSRRKEIN